MSGDFPDMRFFHMDPASRQKRILISIRLEDAIGKEGRLPQSGSISA